jgi:hypothetical protein
MGTNDPDLGERVERTFCHRVDGNGNAFFSEFAADVKEIPSAGGCRTVTTVAGWFGFPEGIAVDN